MSLSLTEAVNLLKSKKWIDLTLHFNADSPHFFMFEPVEFKTLFDYRDGFCPAVYVSQPVRHPY